MLTDTNFDSKKLDQILADAQRRWTKLTEHDLAQAVGNAQQMISLVQQNYGYTRERAEREVDQFLDQYDAKIFNIARSLPGDLPAKVLRRPWATIATALGIGVALGLIAKPGCADSKKMVVEVETRKPADWTTA